jgi:predicted RNA-binding Zn ribbon-like protein
MIENLGDGKITEQDQAALNAIMLNMPLCRYLEKDTYGYQLEMVPLKKDWNWVQAEIAASFAHVLAYHDPRRLKICANTYCRWIFYDKSKSRTKLYCTPEKCANLWKARRYRASHKNNL